MNLLLGYNCVAALCNVSGKYQWYSKVIELVREVARDVTSLIFALIYLRYEYRLSKCVILCRLLMVTGDRLMLAKPFITFSIFRQFMAL